MEGSMRTFDIQTEAILKDQSVGPKINFSGGRGVWGRISILFGHNGGILAKRTLRGNFLVKLIPMDVLALKLIIFSHMV